MTEPWMWQAYPRLMMVGLCCWIVGVGECIHGDGMADCPCGGEDTCEDDFYEEGGEK